MCIKKMFVNPRRKKQKQDVILSLTYSNRTFAWSRNVLSKSQRKKTSKLHLGKDHMKHLGKDHMKRSYFNPLFKNKFTINLLGCKIWNWGSVAIVKHCWSIQSVFFKGAWKIKFKRWDNCIFSSITPAVLAFQCKPGVIKYLLRPRDGSSRTIKMRKV